MDEIGFPVFLPYRAEEKHDQELHDDDPHGKVMPIHEHQVDQGQQDEFERLGFLDAAEEEPGRAGSKETDETIHPTFVRHVDREGGTAVAQRCGDAGEAMKVLFTYKINRDDGQHAKNE